MMIQANVIQFIERLDDKVKLALITSLGFGLWFAFSAIRKFLVLKNVRTWPSMKGMITKSELYRDPKADDALHFCVEYEFMIGEKIRGNTPRFAGDWFWNNSQQKEFVDRYPVGLQVEVFYDPRNPHNNFLDHQDTTGITILLLLSFASLSIAGIIVWMYSI